MAEGTPARLDIPKDVSGWSASDPQLGRVLRTGGELVGDGAGMMAEVIERVPAMIVASGKASGSVSVPWWKFWAKKNR
jgi:hypothetical protein